MGELIDLEAHRRRRKWRKLRKKGIPAPTVGRVTYDEHDDDARWGGNVTVVFGPVSPDRRPK